MLKVATIDATGMTYNTYLQGYTDYDGITPNGNADPRLNHHVNSIIETCDMTINTPLGIYRKEKINKIYNVMGSVETAGYDVETFAQRPGDILDNISALNISFQFCNFSDIYQSEEIAKLKRYIEANQQTLVGNSKNEHLIINAGLSDDDILDSLIGEIIFNKLLTIDLFTKQCNIVSYVFQTIRFKGSFISSDAQAIRSKKTTSDPTKEDISYFEDYRKTSNIPIGTVVEIQHAVSDINFLVSSMGNVNFDFKQYQKDISNLSPYMDNRIDKTQIYLLGWFISKIINPRALFYIEYVKLVELMLFAKNILLNNGQEFFGTLFGCYKHRGHNFINVIIRSGISKQLLKRLSEFYVHTLEDEKQSVIEKTITEASKEIVNSLWVPYDLECLPTSQINKDGFLIVPNNITDIVCNYVEFINSATGVPANV